MSTVLILIDAMRSSYISKEETPFLYSVSNSGTYYKHVVPNFGFCERTEIFTGLNSQQSGYFTAIGYNTENSPYNKIKFLKIFEIIENFLLFGRKLKFFQYIHKFFRKLLNKYIRFETKGISGYNIPLSIIKYWSLTEDEFDIWDNENFPHHTIFSELDNTGKTYYTNSFTSLRLNNGNDSDRLNLALNDKLKNNSDFYLIYISALDQHGHLLGPESIMFKDKLAEVDKLINDFTNDFLKYDVNAKFIYLGDHGMSTVKSYFDADKELKNIARKLKLVIGKDIIYFLDSTIVRIWILNNNHKYNITTELINNEQFKKYGYVIDDRLSEKYKIPFKNRKYGDIMWCSNNGNVINPDYFGNKKLNGMHGYDPNIIDNQGCCIINGNGIKHQIIESIQLTGIKNVIKSHI